ALLMHAWHPSLIFFFFQAEDGIRDRNVTGVQTCALPISRGPPRVLAAFSGDAPSAPRSTPTTLTRVTLHVAPATDADVDEIADLAARTFPLACPPELGAQAVRAFIREQLTASRFPQHLGTPGHRVRCARTHDGRAIGYSLLIAGAAMDETCAGLLHGARPVGVSKFYLDPDFHGTGGAAGLLDAVIDTASADGADSLWL